jgi:hypothetical protein
MVEQRPLSLSDHQLALLQSAARAVPVRSREQFLQGVTRHLAAEPTDAAVQAAVNAALDRVPVFLCDAQPKGEGP